jgi:hypothetical protein
MKDSRFRTRLAEDAFKLEKVGNQALSLREMGMAVAFGLRRWCNGSTSSRLCFGEQVSLIQGSGIALATIAVAMITLKPARCPHVAAN